MTEKPQLTRLLHKTAIFAFSTAALSTIPLVSVAERNTIDVLIAGYSPDIDTDTRLDSRELNDGTLIEFEEDLNLDDSKTLPALFIAYNFGERMSIELAYFDLSRDGSRIIDETIKFGDETFEVNERVDSRFNVDIYRVAINYDFLQSPNWTLGAAAGIHITRFDVGISVAEQLTSEEIDKTAPLPYLSFSADYRFSDGWQVGGTIEYLALSTGTIDGSLLNAAAGIDYSFSDTLGAGLAYNIYNLSVESDSLTDDLEGKFEYSYSGPLVYLRFGF